MLSAVLEELGVAPELLDDVKSAVSEACNNVVLHAYGDEIGPLHVDLQVSATDLQVAVRDHGVGLGHGSQSTGRLRVGMAMMEALATGADFLNDPDGGTDVRLRFATELIEPPAGERRDACAQDDPISVPLAGDAVVLTCPVPFLAAVMGRLSVMIAASARFSLDRLSDLRLLTDAISDQARSTGLGERIGFGVVSAMRRLELAVGPFDPATSARLASTEWSTSPAFLPLLLADELTLEPHDRCQILRAVITDPRPVG